MKNAQKNLNERKKLFSLIKKATPDIVISQAFGRISELPVEQVKDGLFELFNSEKWKIRQTAAITLLRMLKFSQLDEFMSKLPANPPPHFAMFEVLDIGKHLGGYSDGKPKVLVEKYVTSKSLYAKLSAISFFYRFGTKLDIPALTELKKDKTKIPVCDEQDCKWICDIPKKDDPKSSESKEITSVSDYVEFCIEPPILGSK